MPGTNKKIQLPSKPGSSQTGENSASLKTLQKGRGKVCKRRPSCRGCGWTLSQPPVLPKGRTGVGSPWFLAPIPREQQALTGAGVVCFLPGHGVAVSTTSTICCKGHQLMARDTPAGIVLSPHLPSEIIPTSPVKCLLAHFSAD